MACSSCHLTDYKGATNPNHVAAGFPQDCTVCHTTAQWQGATFDHSPPRLPPDRRACSGDLRPVPRRPVCGASTPVFTCHLPDYQKATNPNHVAASFPAGLHRLSHDGAMDGRQVRPHHEDDVPPDRRPRSADLQPVPHKRPVCGLSTQCFDVSPARLPEGGESESRGGRLPAGLHRLSHDGAMDGRQVRPHHEDDFPLTGAHVPVTCNQCHTNGQYAGLSTQCSTCHLPDYQKATNPNHVTAAFPQDCTVCHTTTQWTGATFDHSTKTTFPLTGAHVPVDLQPVPHRRQVCRHFDGRAPGAT